MRCLLVILALIAGMMVGIVPAGAATWQEVYQESQLGWNPTNGMSIINDANASGGQAAKLTKNTTGTITGNVPRLTNVKVRARGDACNGNPNLRITLNGTVVANQGVATGWTEYSFPVNSSAGINQLQVAFTNEYQSWFFFTLICTRTLYVDNVTVTYTDEVPQPPQAGPPPAGSEYVALGDSYSSATGADRTPGSAIDHSVYDGSNCWRSNKSAATLLASQWQLNLIFAACAGATTATVTTSQNGEPPQLDRLGPNTRLVTMTLGGNDATLLGVLGNCIIPGNCWRNNGDFFANWYISQMDAAIAGLQSKVENVLRVAVQRAPQAKIRHAGYPYIIAGPGEPAGTCSAWLVPQEQTFFADAIAATNNAIRAAVQAVAAETGKDVRYVDPLAASSPFMARVNGQMLDGCSTSTQRYMNGPQDGSEGGWHPNIYGQQRYRDLYSASVN